MGGEPPFTIKKRRCFNGGRPISPKLDRWANILTSFETVGRIPITITHPRPPSTQKTETRPVIFYQTVDLVNGKYCQYCHTSLWRLLTLKGSLCQLRIPNSLMLLCATLHLLVCFKWSRDPEGRRCRRRPAREASVRSTPASPPP